MPLCSVPKNQTVRKQGKKMKINLYAELKELQIIL